MRALWSTFFWLFVTLSSIALFPVAVLIWAVTAPFDDRRRALHLFTCFWASLYTWLNPLWPVRIEGKEHIDPRRAYVMAANHQSLLDILVLFRLFVHFKWISKEEIFRVPWVGWNMSLNRYIKLRRGDRESVEKMMAAASDALREGNSVMIFPEGTRSVDGRLKPFKPGAFILAKENRVPLLPIIVRGTGTALPKRGFILRGYHPISVRVLPAIPPEDFASETVDRLSERTWEIIGEGLASPLPDR